MPWGRCPILVWVICDSIEYTFNEPQSRDYYATGGGNSTEPVDVESVKIFEKLFASPKKDMVKVTFKLKVSDFIDPSMVQLYPIELAKQLVDYFCER